jgi:NTP pyrophosphatase (non-canonical NTP hydrolase)
MSVTPLVLAAVLEERVRQDQRWGIAGERRLPAGTWLAVLTEEVGEVANSMLEHDGELAGMAFERFSSELELELVQVAAVALAWLESLHGIRAELEERAA